ncbi:MAG: 1-deoxy-D-xylulose-5-phosphate reductoisomerase [Lachnospiraceae bacterium]|nr:1-deoxy-D-xylulose-5-phosphate reductoisomerase [Lachnospiraceae bacterium]
MKKISILGSTGSIGCQTLDVISRRGGYTVTALAAGRSVRLAEEQARAFKPALFCLYDEAAAADLKVRISDLPTRVVSGKEGLLEAAAGVPADMVSVSILGMIGLEPTIAAIRAGRDLAIANKETLVTAGHLIMPLAKECGIRLLPVDSEHGAIFQCLEGEDRARVTKLFLTASGGPFRGKTREELKEIRPADALKHPNWSMGAKITIDSSTLVNKGLEVMEAHWLYNMPYDQIRVVVHPQSIVHSMVEFSDGSVKAQLAVPDMELPIAYALYYPERTEALCDRLDFWELPDLHFEKPDFENFPGLSLAYEAGRAGGTMPTVYNAANEWAVQHFLAGTLSYPGIIEVIEKAMRAHTPAPDPSLEEVLAAEQWVKNFLAPAGLS